MVRRTLVLLSVGALAACAPDPVAAPLADAGASVRDVTSKPDRVRVDDASPVDAGALDAGAAEDAIEADVPEPEDLPEPEDVSPPIEDAGTVGPVWDYSRAGSFAVGVWTGAIPGVQGTARVFHPTTPGAARLPLVAFAHGFQLSVGNYDELLRHVASWGYVVASVDYPGSLLGVDHRVVPAALTATRMAFAAGRVAGFPVGASVDAARSVAMGHSLGGKGAVWALLDDGAFVAGVALDPVDDSPFGRESAMQPSIAPERMGGLRAPLALFGATQSRCALLGVACAPEASNWRAFADAAPRSVTVAAYPLMNFGHNDFVDTACGVQCLACARGAAPLTTRQLALRGLTVGFLERYTKDVLSAQTYVDGALRDALRASGVLWNGRPETLPPCR